MLFAAMIYDPRPSDASERPKRKLKGIAVPFSLRMEAFAQRELSMGIQVPTRGPDFGLSGPVERFAAGAAFEDVLESTTLQPGDLVRTLRMTIQLLRQTAHALPKGDPCVDVLRDARARIDRDVVDAKRQLELG
jgi:superfamily II RNA helicase